MRYDIVGIGVSAVDVLTVVEEFPAREGVQRAVRSSVQGGGPVATASKLGASAAMIDRIGDDWRGRLISEDFRRCGVSEEWVETARGRSSAIASILVRRRDGARAIVFSPGDAEEMGEEDLPRRAIEGARIVHGNGRHLGACLAAFRFAREKGVLVSFDGGAHRYRPELDALLPYVDLCIVARSFAEEFAGTTDPERAARALGEAGPPVVVITAGEEGSWIYEGKKAPAHQPAFPLERVIDTTGCGDAYHGAFLFGSSRGMELCASARFASAVAAIVACGLGGREPLPTLEEVERFLALRNGRTKGE